MKDTKEYALYKGDEYITSGTLGQIAIHQNVKRETVQWWKYPTNDKRNKGNRKTLICLD